MGMSGFEHTARDQGGKKYIHSDGVLSFLFTSIQG
jgi:hypothetical protein